MKRCREEEEGAVNSLILLSRGVGGTEVEEQPLHQLPSRVYECKTCNRQFHSFQALGGHRASHKKLRSIDEHPQKVEAAAIKPKTHECSICGSEFAIGQALGGHMRRHRATASATEAFSQSPVSKKSDNRRVFGLDLNLTPFENEFQRAGLFGLDFVKKIPMVDCFN